MPAWFSPFPLEPAFKQRLDRCGWTAWPGDLQDLPSDGVGFYGPPDQLLADDHAALGVDAILEGYRALLDDLHPHRLINAWRLLASSEDALRSTLEGDGPPAHSDWPSPDPLGALITRAVLESNPALLDAYLDLELKADLLGGEPDTRYRKRLQSALVPDLLLEAWRRPAALLTQLDHTQELLHASEQQFLGVKDDLAKQDQMRATLNEECNQLRKALDESSQSHHQQMQALEQQFSSARDDLQRGLQVNQMRAAQIEALSQRHRELVLERDGAQTLLAQQEQAHQQQLAVMTAQQQQLEQQLGETRQEGQLTLQQLHLTQEELEHFLQHGREQALQLQALSQQMDEQEQNHQQQVSILLEQLGQLEQQLSGAREEGQITLQQLFQASKDLERRESELVVERNAALAQQEQAHQQQLAVMTAQQQQLEQQLGETRQEGQLTLQQLHLTQEELEHFFRVARSQTEHLERYELLLRRCEQLLLSALND